MKEQSSHQYNVIWHYSPQTVHSSPLPHDPIIILTSDTSVWSSKHGLDVSRSPKSRIDWLQYCIQCSAATFLENNNGTKRLKWSARHSATGNYYLYVEVTVIKSQFQYD